MAKYSMKVYGWDAVTLYKNYSIEELTKLMTEVREHPDNQRVDKSSVYLFVKEARQQLDVIGWAIYYHLRDKREKEIKNGNEKTS